MTVLIDYTKGFFETTEGDTVGTVTGNATLDLSTGSVFSHTPTANTTFAFTNPAPSGTSSSATLKLTGATLTSAYDIANASYDSKSYDPTTQATAPSGFYIKPDGTKLYIVDNGTDTIYQYTLSTAWDISTASYDSVSISVSSQDIQPNGITFKPDGTIMYHTSNSGNNMDQYTLSTAWDLSTASYANKSYNLHLGAVELIPRNLVFNSTGTILLVAGGTNDTVYQHNLSTAWDISTASYASKSLNVSSQETGLHGIYLKPDDSKLWILGFGSNTVYQYSITSADASTASYDNVSFSVASQSSSSYSVFFGDSGAKMYVLDSLTDTIYQYSTGSSALATITYPASVIWSGGTTPTAPANGETDVYSFYTDDGGTTYYGFVSGDALA
jgi:6-phosphogluconolactonase (cycloisomerase 2 family)